MAWLIYGCVALASGVASGAVVYLLTLRLPEGWALVLLSSLVMSLFALAAVFIAGPADYGQHQTLATFMWMWPMITGMNVGRGEARKRLDRVDESQKPTL